MILSHYQYLELPENSLNIFKTVSCSYSLNSNSLNMKIPIVTGVPIWVIFQNSVAYTKAKVFIYFYALC